MGSVTGRGETLTAVHSTLRESFLASDHAENHEIPRSLVGISLAAVLNNERNSTSNSTVVKTLFDIIQTEESPSNHPTSNSSSGKKSWKLLKERLKLRRNTASNAVRSEVEPNPFASESLREDAGAVMEGNDDQIQRSSSMRLADALAAEREMIRFSSVPLNQEEPIRMSLMDLLEDSTENQAEIQGPENESDDNEEGAEDEDLGHHMMVEEEEEEEEEEKGGGALMAEMACCVCMVRHKGAAFIPCGHTFCRMCSRELWVKRGNCPLCNNSILEILDIF